MQLGLPRIRPAPKPSGCSNPLPVVDLEVLIKPTRNSPTSLISIPFRQNGDTPNQPEKPKNSGQDTAECRWSLQRFEAAGCRILSYMIS